MLRLISSALVVAALIAVPTSGYSQDKSKTETTAPAKQTTAKQTTAPAKKAKEPTKGQTDARDRMKQCGAEWQEAKKAGKVQKGQTWPKYWSECNTRLKAKQA